MHEKWIEFRRRKAGWIAALAALLLLGLFAAVRVPQSRKNAATPEARASYLASLGWEIEAGSEESTRVTIPDCASGTMAAYNALMRRAGFDLSPYAGKQLQQYRYVLSNYPGCDQKVYAVLYVSAGRVVGGDIHTAALDGFMHELRARE